MNRRGFLNGILAAATAPYVVTAAGVLMPVRKIALPEWGISHLKQVGAPELQDQLNRYMADMMDRVMYAVVVPPELFSKLQRDETADWVRVARAAGYDLSALPAVP